MPRQHKLSEADLSAVKEEMRAIMIEMARARETITYSELALRLQTAYVHYHSFTMARLLNDIGSEEIDAGRGVLPAVVVTKTTGIPGGGYFGIARHEVADANELNELEAYWRQDLEAVFDYWADPSDNPTDGSTP